MVRFPPDSPLASVGASLLLAIACAGGDAVEPEPPPPTPVEPRLRFVAGTDAADTVESLFAQALVVEVRGRDGNAAAGVVVRFEAQPTTNAARRADAAVHVCTVSAPVCGPTGGAGASSGSAALAQFTSDTTDAKGMARALVRLGRVAGPARVRLTVPEFGIVDSAKYTAAPGRAVRLRAVTADTLLAIGASVAVQAHLVDRLDNERADPITVSLGATTSTGAGPLAAGGGAGQYVTRDVGTQWVVARTSTLADSVLVRARPAGRISAWNPSGGELFLIDLDGRNRRTVVSGVSSDYGTFPRFDPARQRLALHFSGTINSSGTSRGVMLVDTTGTPRRQVTHPSIGSILATRPMADGSILVLSQRPAATIFELGTTLWRVAPDNGVSAVAQLADIPALYGGPDISPDGTRVAYATASTVGGNSRVQVVDVATGTVRTIENGAVSPRWSPQGDRLAYLVAPTGGAPAYAGEGALTVANADGTGRRTLGSRTASFSPGLSWSPDGTHIIGRSTTYPGLRIVRVADEAEVSFRTPFEHFQPDWR